MKGIDGRASIYGLLSQMYVHVLGRKISLLLREKFSFAQRACLTTIGMVAVGRTKTEVDGC